MFPYPTSYRSLRDNTVTYFQYIGDVKPGRLLFHRIEGKDDRACIKFVKMYSLEAHACLTSLGCAPALRGFENLANRWCMVVMDWVGKEFENLSDAAPPALAVLEHIRAKLVLFHEAAYVHGDLCAKHVVVSKSKSPDEMQFMIVGLDCAGKAGEARYPFFLDVENWEDDDVDRGTGNTRRPPGAHAGEMILAVHDLEMLRYMTELDSDGWVYVARPPSGA